MGTGMFVEAASVLHPLQGFCQRSFIYVCLGYLDPTRNIGGVVSFQPGWCILISVSCRFLAMSIPAGEVSLTR